MCLVLCGLLFILFVLGGYFTLTVAFCCFVFCFELGCLVFGHGLLLFCGFVGWLWVLVVVLFDF